MRRENDEMRQNLTRLRRKAETSEVQLSVEQEKQSGLFRSLEVAKKTLIVVGNLMAGARKEWLGEEAEELSQQWDVEEIAQKVMDLALSFQASAMVYVERLQRSTTELEEFVREKTAEIAAESNWDQSNAIELMKRLWEAKREVCAHENASLQCENTRLSALAEQYDISLSMLKLQLSEKAQEVSTLQREVSHLENELTAKGYILSTTPYSNQSINSVLEIEEGSVSDDAESHHSDSSVEE